MRILIDITHPAHAHFFRHPIRLLQKEGHEIIVTSRSKDVTLNLLDAWNIPHIALSSHHGTGAFGLLRELITRDYLLMRLVRKLRPQCMTAIGGTFIAHVGYLTGIPTFVFYDTENATLQNAITYPFASFIFTPRCYKSWVPNGKHVSYAGYHELSYLHPLRFKADRNIAIKNGLDPVRPTFLIRLVAWKANHDFGEKGWSQNLLWKVIDRLHSCVRVLITTEASLPQEFDPYLYSGNVENIHHVMAFCSGFIGESATMASESAVLGVPAVYAANTGRCYTDEQETLYGIVKNVRHLMRSDLEPAIDWLLSLSKTELNNAHKHLLNDTIDVADFVTKSFSNYHSHMPAPHQES